MQIVESVVLLDTEQALVAEALANPVVKKYFISLGRDLAQQLLSCAPSEQQTDSDYIRNEAIVKGQLILLETLLSIQKPTKE